MEEEEDKPPFWLQNTDRHRRLRRTSSLLLNSGFLLIFLLAIAFVFIFIVVPSFLSITSQIFRPQSVKKSWDSLNLVLVLFAIVCGFLSRNNNSNNNESTSSYEDYKFTSTVQKSNPSTPRQWYEYSSDRTAYNTLQRQRSSSYPDLRQESSWVTSDDRWRFYDDSQVNNYSFLTSDQLHHRRPRRDIDEEEEEGDASYKKIGADTVAVQKKEVSYTAPPPSAPPQPPSPSSTQPTSPLLPSLPPRSSSPPPTPPSPPPPTPPKVVKGKVKRTYQDLTPKERPENKNLDIKKYRLPPPSPPPPPPPVFGRNAKKRGAASATKDFLTSLGRKKKKQRQKSVENLESLFNPEPSALPLYPPPSPAPPPPPPPPPPPFFQNIFSSKKGKSKKIPSVPPPPPPPPPSLVSQPRVRSHEAHASKTKVQNAPTTSHKPSLPVKISNYNSAEENAYIGNESPLNIPIPPPLPPLSRYQIPPPPPLPPFKMKELKYVVNGDYVRIKSNYSSPSSEETSPSESGGSPMSPFCPSPDVDTKADNFIARFRAGLRLEKMNSVKGRSNLGPQATTSPDTKEGEAPS